MLERRKDRRLKLARYLSVYSDRKEHPFGQLMDVSSCGMMLRSSSPVRPKDTFRFSIVLPGTLFGAKRISFEARSIWCRRDEATDSYHIGFQLLDLPDKAFADLRRLIVKVERVY